MNALRSSPCARQAGCIATADVNFLGEMNAAAVVEAIRLLGPISRADLARRANLKPPALTGIVRYLLQEGLVIEGEEVKPGAHGGRPSRLLRVNSASHSVLGIDLEPDHLRAAVTDLGGAILNYRQTVVDRRQSPEHTLRLLTNMVREMGVRKGSVVRIGVSCAGLLDEEAGVLLSSTNMPLWKNVPLRRLLTSRFGAPVSMGRSIHQAAWAEHWFRQSPDPVKMIVVTLRTGIGFALVDGGVVYRGKQGLDGELGHTVVDLHGLPCECGRRGCLETMVSPASITRRAQAMLQAGRGRRFQPLLDGGTEIDPEVIYRWARDGDAASREIVNDVIRYLGLGIANLVNLLAPDCVVLCGAIDVVNEELLTKLREEIRRQCLPRSWEGIEVRLSKHAERSALLGAAVRAAHEHLTAVIQHRAAVTT